jgi:hypothetical protein
MVFPSPLSFFKLEGLIFLAENLSNSSQNIVLMLDIATSIANVVLHLMEIKNKVFANHVNP